MIAPGLLAPSILVSFTTHSSLPWAVYLIVVTTRLPDAPRRIQPSVPPVAYTLPEASTAMSTASSYPSSGPSYPRVHTSSPDGVSFVVE